MAKKEGTQFVDIPLHKLKPHPRNPELYAKRSRWQIEELAQDMDQNGQTEAVEVTSDLTIISGHGRLEAAKLLGWKKIRCWIRDDLDTSDAIELRLVEANLHRRQLSRLDMVRSYRHIKQLAKNQRGRSPSKDKIKGDLRDILAKRFGLSGRTLDRWLQVLELPMPIQEAVSQDKLPLTLAVKVAVMSTKIQAQIAERIKAGENPTEVVQGCLPSKNAKQGTAMNHLLRALAKGRAELEHRIHEVEGGLFGNALEELRKSKVFLGRLIAQLERNSEKTVNKLKRMKERDFNDEEE
jgi:ParB family transcriptional regulator, chromosome partitioning protein